MTAVEQHPVVVRWRKRVDALSEFVLRDEAIAFIAHEQRHHPDELTDWLSSVAVSTLVRGCAGVSLRRERGAARERFRRAANADDVTRDDFEDPRNPFMAMYVVDSDNRLKRLGDMVAADHLFVAASYQREGKRALLLHAFHRAVARRLGDRTTADAFTAAQYGRLLGAIEDGHRPPELFAADEAA